MKLWIMNEGTLDATSQNNYFDEKVAMEFGSSASVTPEYSDLARLIDSPTVNASQECKIRNADGNPMVNMTIPLTTFSICVAGNLFAIIFLWRSNQRSDKKQHIFYTLVMTLAICDFVSVIVTSPITFVAYMSGRCVLELGGMPLCWYSGFAMIFFGIGSVAIVFAMSLERFIAIRFTLFYQRSMTTHKTRVFLIVIILSLLALSSLPLLGFGNVAQQFPGSWCFLDWKSPDARHQGFNFIVAILGITLMLGTIICNFIVVIRVSTARRQMRNKNSSHGLLPKGKRKRISQQEKQMMILLAVMTIVFVVCYLPLLLRILVNQVSVMVSPESASLYFSSWDLFAVRMASINPIIDPWVYILCRRSVLLKVFRFFKLVFTCRFQKSEFQELFVSNREFRRRKSTRRHLESNASSSHRRSDTLQAGYRKSSRSPQEKLSAIEEIQVTENSAGEVNGNHISLSDKKEFLDSIASDEIITSMTEKYEESSA